MTAPSYGYPSGPPSHTAPWQQVRRAPRWTAGILAGIAFLAAAAATVWGSFETIQTFRQDFSDSSGGNDNSFGYTVTWWDLEQTGRGITRAASYPPYGVLLAAAAGLLLIAAVLALSAFGNRRAGVVTAARVIAGLGVGLLAGTVSVRLMDGLQALSDFNSQEANPGESTTFQVGLGIWLPGGAVVLALAGLILALTRPRAVRVEPDTPRMGVPMPYPQYQPQPYQQSHPPTGQSPVSAPPPAPEPRPEPATERPQTGEQEELPRN